MEELKLKNIQPRANTVITTAIRYYEKNNKEAKDKYIKTRKDNQHLISLKEDKNLPKLVQKVVAIGPVVHDVKVGDIVKINPLHYLDRKLIQQRESLERDVLDLTGTRVKETYSELDYKFPTIDINEKECLLLYDRDIDYIILDAQGDIIDELKSL